MADYNIIQITPEKVEQACMQTKPRPTYSMPTPIIITPEKVEQNTSSSHKPNLCPPSNITTINPPCKPEQNVVAIDLVQLRQVLNQAQKDVTERLKVYATLENLKEEAETRYSEDQVLAEKLKQLEEVTQASLEEVYNNIEAILLEYATKELVNAEITAVQDTIEQVEQELTEHITQLGSELDVNVDDLQNKIEDVQDTLEQELEEGLASKVDASMFDSVLQSANTAVGQLQTKTSTLEQEMDSVEAAVENLEIDLNNLNTEIEQKSVIIGSNINDLSQRLDEQEVHTETLLNADLVSSQSIGEVEDFNLQIVSQIPVIEVSTTASTFTIESNTMYRFGNRTELTINLAPGREDIVNEYMFQFTSASVPTTLTVPSSVKWLKAPEIKSNKTYMVSIENNLGIIGEW